MGGRAAIKIQGSLDLSPRNTCGAQWTDWDIDTPVRRSNTRAPGPPYATF
jgi:hypothetical protein